MEHRLLALICHASDARSDADLVAARDDHGAFAELVARHGPMVWSVCRQLLQEADAEDAFQAAFVALLKAAVRDHSSIASWLYGAAVRISLSQRRAAGRRRKRERFAAAPEAHSPSNPDEWADTMEVIHREVAALPDADRAAFVLCELKGLTQAEAAARLGRTPGSVAGQVARAKKRLVARLTERGITPGLAALTASSLAEAIPPALADRVLKQPLAISKNVSRLAQGATGMSGSTKRWIGAVGSAVCVMLAAIGLHAAAPEADQKPNAAEAAPVPKGAEGGRTWKAKLSEKGTGKPIAGAEISLSITADEEAGKQLAKLDRTVKLKSAEDGTYEFTIPPEEILRRSLYLEFTITAPDHVEYFGGYSYSLILKNETLGQRAFFEHIALWPGRPIEGTVKTPDGKPATGIKVLAYTSPGPGRAGIGRFPETKTDDRGRFRLMIYAEGKAAFWILPQDHAPEVHGVAADQKGDRGEFTLAKGERLAGKLLDSAGKPVAGVYVEANPVRRKEDKEDVVPNNVANQIHRAAVTAADGSFEFRPLPAATYRVMPAERGWDPTTQERRKEPERRPLPAVFLPRQVVLKTGLEPIVVRAVPHVTLDIQWLNSKGEKRPGSDVHIGGAMGKRFWNTTSSPSADGRCRVLVPKGLEAASLEVIYDPDSALQYRLHKDGLLKYSRHFELGDLKEDNAEIQIIRFAAPTIVMSAAAKDGKPIKNFLPSVEYTDPEYRGSKLTYKGKSRTDVPFEELPGDKIRTIQLVPDREARVTIQADGFKAASRTITLKEGKTEEMKFELEPN